MNEERTRILRMVADGTITAEEGADLLDAIGGTETRPLSQAAPVSPAAPAAPMLPANPNRVLHIVITSGGETNVNLRLPLGLARAASRFIPRQAQAQLKEYDIKVEELLQDLAGARISGPILEVGDSDDRVLITVE